MERRVSLLLMGILLLLTNELCTSQVTEGVTTEQALKETTTEQAVNVPSASPSADVQPPQQTSPPQTSSPPQPPTTSAQRQASTAAPVTTQNAAPRVTTAGVQTTTQSVTTSPPIPCPQVCICSLIENETQVDCSDRGLRAVPDDLPPSTTVLYLNKNDLQILPERAFANVSNLKYLYMSASNIDYLPAGVFDGLSDLRSIDLTDNKISSILHVFDGLTQLEDLDLSENQLPTLPNDVFNSLTSLRNLKLMGNEIDTVTPGTFDSTVELRHLYLNSNNLADLQEHMFGSLVNLEQLHLDRNAIETIPRNVFQSLRSLQILSLNFMSISTVTNTAFHGLANLVTLSLSSNRLSSLAMETLLPLTKLRTLILNGNQWRCDCKMKQLYDYLLTRSSVNFSPQNIRCHAPSHVSGQSLSEVKTSSFACEPFIIQFPRDKTVMLGQRVEFSCSVLGDPEPELYWQTPQGTFDSSSPAGRVYVSSSIGSSKLFVDPVEPGDSGTYNCVANNSRGSEEADAVLTVQQPPPATGAPATCGPAVQPVQCVQPTLSVYTRSVGENVVDVAWVPAYGSDSTGYSVSVTKFGYSSPAKEDNVSGLSSWFHSITELEALTQYIICVSRRDSGCPDVVSFENCIHITTGGTPVRQCVRNYITVAVDNVTETSLLVKWVASSTQNADGYIVELREFGGGYEVLKNTDVSVNSLKFNYLTADSNYIACVTFYYAEEVARCDHVTLTSQCRQVSTRGGVVRKDNQHTFEIIGVFFATCIGTLLILASIFVIWWRYKKPPSLKKYEFHKETKKHRSADDGTTPITLSDVITSQISEGASASQFPADGGYVNDAAVIDDFDEIKPYPAPKPKAKQRSKGKRRPDPLGEEDQHEPANSIEHVAEVYTSSDAKSEPSVELIKMNGKEPEKTPESQVKVSPTPGKAQNQKNKATDSKINGGPTSDIDITIL